MSGPSSPNAEDQHNEILALTEICSGDEFEPVIKKQAPAQAWQQLMQLFPAADVSLAENGGYLKISPDLNGQPWLVKSCSSSQDVPLRIRHLAPVSMAFIMPQSYPTVVAPLLHVSAVWISPQQRRDLEQKLLALWQENAGSVILFTWIGFVKQELMDFLHLDNGVLDLSPVIQEEQQGAHSSQTLDSSVSRRPGLIIRVFRKRHYGFVLCQHSQAQYFFGLKEFQGDAKMLKSNMPVSFILGPSKNHNFTHEAVEILPMTDHIHCDHDGAEAEGAAAGRSALLVRQVIKTLREFDEAKASLEFEQASFQCNVCFDTRSGRSSIRFADCDHVYCKPCMTEYFKVQINSGLVSSLTCPEEQCSSQAMPYQVKELVPKDLYAKYEKFLLAVTLDSMPDVLPCPRLGCQCPTLIMREESMGVCAKCSFAFCIFCKFTYHGIEPCKMKSAEQEKLVKEYMAANEEQKLLMEKRYGKKHLSDMVREMLSKNYIDENTQKCPKCNISRQKSDGCNKMTCYKCQTHFCYLCGLRLPMDNPYFHFSSPDSPCFSKLFEGVQNEEEDSDDEDLEIEDDFLLLI